MLLGSPAGVALALDSLMQAQTQLTAPGAFTSAVAVQQVHILKTIAEGPTPLTTGVADKVAAALTVALGAMQNSTGLAPKDAELVASVASSVLFASWPADNAATTESRTTPSPRTMASLGAVVENAAGGLLQGLLNSRGPSQAVGAALVNTITTPGLQIMAAALPVQLGSEDTVQIPGTPLLAGLPAGAVATAAEALTTKGYTGNATVGVSVVLYNVNPYGPSKRGGNMTATEQCSNATGPARSYCSGTAVGQVVALSLGNRAGPVAIQNLEAPFQFVVSLSSPMSYEDTEQALMLGYHPACRYWDVKQWTWSTKGCRTLGFDADGSKLLCACTHMTSFGPFTALLDLGGTLFSAFELAASRVICNYAGQLLSQQGMVNVAANGWANRGAALAFFLLCSLETLSYVLAAGRDWRLAQLAVQVSQDQQRSSGGGSMLSTAATLLLAVLGFFLKPIFRNYRWREDRMVRICDLIAANRIGIDRPSLRTLRKYEDALNAGTLPDLRENAGRIDGVPLDIVEDCHRSLTKHDQHPGVYVTCSQAYAEAFRTGDSYMFLQLCASFHPMRVPSVTSLHRRHAGRVILQQLSLNCGLFMSALFFHYQGAVSRDSSDECSAGQRGIAQAIGQVFVCGLTIMASEGPSQLLVMLDDNNTFGNGTRRHCLIEAGKVILLNFFSLSLNAFYLLFLVSFIANLQEREVQTWLLINFLTLLAMFLVLKPFLWAVASILLSIFHRLMLRIFSARVAPASATDTSAAGTSTDQAATFDLIVPGGTSHEPAGSVVEVPVVVDVQPGHADVGPQEQQKKLDTPLLQPSAVMPATAGASSASPGFSSGGLPSSVDHFVLNITEVVTGPVRHLGPQPGADDDLASGDAKTQQGPDGALDEQVLDTVPRGAALSALIAALDQ